MYTRSHLMARNRNDAFNSPRPRLPNVGPSRYPVKLEPWFIEFARLFKDEVKRSILNREKVRESHRRQKTTGHPPIHRPPVAVLPGWPRTVGEMISFIGQYSNPQLGQVLRSIVKELPAQYLETDLVQVLPSVLSMLKYQVTIPELWFREMQGDRKAGSQVVEIGNLYNRWIHELLPTAGVRFKTNPVHNLIMLYGIAGGLEKLTCQELADFFDNECPCGETHSLEVLVKLRRKLLRAIIRGQEAIASITAANNDATTSKEPAGS
jgi:hypothetical protein